MARVVTLTGPGGGGKTRLALRVAALAEAGFGDGARLVELAPLTDSTLVPASVAHALGVSERDVPTPAAGLARALAGRELLVVLDNCEHVLEAAAGLVASLLAQCRRVRFLATSRERLDVPGELVFPVPPLGLPADGSAAAVAASEAGMLFAARAAAASPAFELSAHNSAAVAEVCARLDGMPLAIELAAARCPALDPAELAARLDGRPGLLSGGPARPGRHRSLEALVAWSYELLDDSERRLLARLSVLRGGFDLGTAERVAAGGPLRPEAIAGLLASLAGKSVVHIHDGAAVRYSLLETIRQFAAGQLAASGEQTAVHLRLLEWALDEARSAEATVGSSRWTAWASRLSAEQASIRAALSWALGGQEPDAGRELAARLARWWIATGRYSEAGQFLTTAAGVPAAAAPGIQARVLLGAAWSAFHLGDNPAERPRSPPTASPVPGRPVNRSWKSGAATCWPAWRGTRAMRTGSSPKSKPAGFYPARQIRRSRRGRRPCWPAAAFLSGDLAEQERHGLLAIELARTAAGQEGLALALTMWSMSAIAGAGIQPATVAALDEAANVLAAHPDRFTETIMHQLSGGAVRHPGPARSGRNRGRIVLGRGTRRRRPAGGIRRPAGRGPPRRRQGRHRGRRRRAAPGSRRRAPRRERHVRSRRPGPPGVHGRHRR